MTHVVRNVLGWSGILAIVLLTAILSETVPLLQDLDAFIAQHKSPLLIATIGMSAIGFVLMIGGILHMILLEGTPTSDEAGEALSRGNRDREAVPDVWPTSTYHRWSRTIGGQAHDEFSFQEMKAAWRTGAWREETRWRRRFITTLGGLLAVFGLFSILFVIGEAWLKLLVGGAMLYAFVRLGWAFWRA
ncbi:MAG: hypothetical protein M3220_22000 [Chloroflexota bacterium]|nr:hypothetical protein [Chloroflexota bacterium]